MRFLLLQARNSDDPMRENERAAFARAAGCNQGDIRVLDLLTKQLSAADLEGTDVVFLGGSGSYSVLDDLPWIASAARSLELLYERKQPTFASCFGFQLFARALGGKVVHAPDRAELGTHRVWQTPAGMADPLLGSLPDPLHAHMGHEDCVEELPADAVLLAHSAGGVKQAYTFPGRPIYATQFHPELIADDLLVRVKQYPEYLELVTGMTFARFRETIFETPAANELIKRFLDRLKAEKIDGGTGPRWRR